MVIEYSKDLYHNYLRINEHPYVEENSYCIRMLGAEGLYRLLKPDYRRLDDQVYLYYDITAKQSIHSLLVKSALSKASLQQILEEVFEAIETAYEYLLDEKDILINPETIFYNLNSNKYEVCYLPGYGKDVNDQLISFMEYLMNKVDYNDKEAVLLIYGLYAAGREEGYAFEHMLQSLRNSTRFQPEIERVGGDGDPKRSLAAVQPQTEVKQVAGRMLPVMPELDFKEQEAICYPVKTYLGTIGCCLAAVLVLLLSFNTKLLYNSLGNRFDFSKLFAMLLILFCAGGFLMRKLWDKKNRITRMVTRKEYHDPRQEIELDTPPLLTGKYAGFRKPIMHFGRWKEPIANGTGELKRKEELPSVISYVKEAPCEQEQLWKGYEVDQQKQEMDEESNGSTCLLNAAEPEYGCILKPMERTGYESIPIKNFPFFIGKLRKNVDYCLEKEVVSRYHAKITREGNRYFLTDLNSTNGTFLNREALMTYQQKELRPGDEISFANIRYLFVSEHTHTIEEGTFHSSD